PVIACELLPMPLSFLLITKSCQDQSTDGASPPPQIKLRRASLCTRLAGLFFQGLAGNAHALLLVRIRRTQRAHVRGNLANLALVRAAHDEVRLLFHGD